MTRVVYESLTRSVTPVLPLLLTVSVSVIYSVYVLF